MNVDEKQLASEMMKKMNVPVPDPNQLIENPTSETQVQPPKLKEQVVQVTNSLDSSSSEESSSEEEEDESKF